MLAAANGMHQCDRLRDVFVCAHLFANRVVVVVVVVVVAVVLVYKT